jgi:hypothetical protein
VFFLTQSIKVLPTLYNRNKQTSQKKRKEKKKKKKKRIIKLRENKINQNKQINTETE